MKQYARLRLPSYNNNAARPTLIWHTYAAIEATVGWVRAGQGRCVGGGERAGGVTARLGMAMQMEIEQ